MADLGLSLGVPNTMPVGGVGQQPHSTPQRQGKKKKKSVKDQKDASSAIPSQALVSGQKEGHPHGKGDLVDIFV